MRHGEFGGMGTTIQVWSPTTEAFHAVVKWFGLVERVCSRFLPDSELSRLNRDGRPNVAVSPLLASVLSRASEMKTLTEGLVDVGQGAALVSWGYDRSIEALAGLDEEPGPAQSGVWSIESGVVGRTAGTLLDLGGVAKGWACDVAVESGLATVAAAGGDLRSAHGETRVPVLDPWGAEVATVALGEGALATSCTTKRRWRVGENEAHHVIDPRTSRPAVTPILSASVVAATAAEAEAGAKSVLILGEEGLVWAEKKPWIDAALVVWHDGSVFATSGLELAA